MSEGPRLTERPAEASPLHHRADPGDFASRHRFLLVLLWVQLPAMAALGLARGEALQEVAAACLLLIVLATVGMVARSRALASGAVALGLVGAAGILVLYMKGSTESLFAFFLAMGAVSLYRHWKPLLFGFAAVVVFHLIASFTVFDPAVSRSTAVLDPMAWTFIHLGATLLLVLLLMAGWRLSTRSDTRRARSEEGLRVGFETAPSGMAVLTPSGEFLQVNQAMTQILGYENENLIGVHIDSVVHGDDHGELGGAWEEMGNGDTHTADTWLRCVTAQGQAIWTRLSLSLIPGVPDHPAVVLLHVEDTTRAYRDQKRLESLIQGSDRFVAAVGEEIRQPLSSILDLTAIAGKDHVELDRALPTIEALATEAAAVVDDLVISARAETGPVSVVAGPLDAGRLCREVLEGFPDRQKLPMGVGATELWADPDLTKHIVSTLLRNAIRYGGPRVELMTLTSGPDTLIRVMDNGPEIPVSERQRMFSSDLRRGQQVTQPVSVGLSLSVARHLARQMDGDLEYRRTSDGHNVFELRLPSVELSPAASAVDRLRSEPLGVSA